MHLTEWLKKQAKLRCKRLLPSHGKMSHAATLNDMAKDLGFNSWNHYCAYAKSPEKFNFTPNWDRLELISEE